MTRERHAILVSCLVHAVAIAAVMSLGALRVARPVRLDLTLLSAASASAAEPASLAARAGDPSPRPAAVKAPEVPPAEPARPVPPPPPPAEPTPPPEPVAVVKAVPPDPVPVPEVRPATVVLAAAVPEAAPVPAPQAPAVAETVSAPAAAVASAAPAVVSAGDAGAGPANGAGDAAAPTGTGGPGIGGAGLVDGPIGEGLSSEDAALIMDRLKRYLAYPERARLNGWNGRVILSFRLGTDGKARSIKVVTSSGFQVLDRSAVAAVQRASPFILSRRQETELLLPVVYALR